MSHSVVAVEPMQYRKKTWLELQPYLLGYGACISVVSPSLTGWQLAKVYSKAVSVPTLARLGVNIFPHQTALKALQMNAATPVKENVSPWVAFGLVGVLQGGVYGQCIVYLSRMLKIGQATSLTGMFRGSAFAGARDTISQGVPFMFSSTVLHSCIEPLCPNIVSESSEGAALQRAVAVGGTSIFATFASQAFHNLQIKMQSDQAATYSSSVRTLYREHGMRMFYMGGSARVALLLLVNGLNDVILKPAWEPVAITPMTSCELDDIPIIRPLQL